MAGRQKTLLCVDDNQSSLKICKMVLEDFGYRVLTASSGREGLEVFVSNAIDAVILDYQMPEMNGELVAAEIRKTNPRVPILMLCLRVSAQRALFNQWTILSPKKAGRVLAPSSSANC